MVILHYILQRGSSRVPNRDTLFHRPSVSSVHLKGSQTELDKMFGIQLKSRAWRQSQKGHRKGFDNKFEWSVVKRNKLWAECGPHSCVTYSCSISDSSSDCSVFSDLCLYCMLLTSSGMGKASKRWVNRILSASLYTVESTGPDILFLKPIWKYH